MSFNLFGPATQNDIKVSYIDPQRGLINDVTVCEANEYAQKNPGTTFIFNTRKVIKYISINDVNRLTPDDLDTEQVCRGVEFDADCGPLGVFFYGGGGIGAKANPVVGEDGSLLAIDLVAGGFGYQFPPIVEAKNECGVGSGAFIRAILGEVVDTEEVFDQESDFENYELCEPSDIGYGKKYGANGEDLGTWDPTSFANLSEDPIRREILEYQEFLQRLSKPWWTTRKFAPLRTSSFGKVTRSKFDVTFPQWSDFMNQYAISPVPPSNARGSDFATIPFSFEWEEDFPFDGDYVFKGLCDNKAELYIDGNKVFDLGNFDQAPSPSKKRISKGVHTIKLDLFNEPIYEEIPGQAGPDFLPVTFNVYGQGKKTQALDFHFTSADKSHSFVIRGVNKNKERRTDIIRLKPNMDYKVQAVSTRGAVEQGLLSGGGGEKGANSGSKAIFADYVESANDNDDLQVRAQSGRFYSGKKSTTPGGERSTFKLSYRYDVEASRPELAEKSISSKSWNENPMGVALTIDAPLPPVPQEPIPPQEGRCPNNPIWTTRFPNSSQKWWPVIFDDRWSNFMNRYAISPIPPSAEKGSDGGGVSYRNSWTVDIPYDGFYGVQGTRDNFGRLLIDGNPVSGLNGFSRNDPETTKVFLTRGMHQIDVEIENEKTESFNVVDRKIFDTLDWGVPVSVSAPTVNSKIKPSFVQKGRGIFLEVGGSGTGEILFSMDVDDNPAFAGIAGREIIIPTDTGRIRLRRDPTREYDNDKGRGSFTAGKSYGPIQIIGAGPGARGPIINRPNRLGLRDADGDGENIKIIISDVKNDKGSAASSGEDSALLSGTANDGVSYSGEELFKYAHPQWSAFMNKRSVSPKSKIISGGVKMTWSNVNFPEDGQYEFFLQGDNIATVFLDGAQVASSTNFKGDPISKYVTLTKGRKTIEIDLQNVEIVSKNFDDNPCGVALRITKKINVSTGTSRSWTVNPIGISAILIPPPCPKKVRGKGVVVDILVDDPGNGYQTPFADLPAAVAQVYPTALRLKSVLVEDPGINYSCGSDQIQITPSNGAVLDYECDTFGRIVNVKVLNPGLGFTRYPEITIPSNTGVNATFRPQFEVVRDPIVADPTKLIQVTDLVGLKQTGYVDGRPYYGSVFYKDGVRYAGFYETVGDLVQVYTTLQESIDAQVTTPPSAIQRQGTDVTSNDPRLNLPGTPENLI